MSQTAFVTGATGFVGGHLVRQLVDRQWDVTILARETSPMAALEGLPLTKRTGDITDLASVQAAMPTDVDAVFHVAASTNIWSRHNEQQTRINVDGTRNVLETAITKGAGRFIHTSSFIVWGFQEGPLTEDTPWTEGDEWINYLRTKRIAENLVREAVISGRIDGVICNPAHILGPGDHHNWSRMIRLVNTGKLPGIPPGGGAFGDVREIAKAHISAYEVGRKGCSYLLGGPDTLFQEVIGLTGDLLGRPVPKRPSPAWQLTVAARLFTWVAAITGKAPDITPEGAAMIVRHIDCDSSRAIEELGYRYTPVKDLLRDTCQWMREEGLL